VMTISCADLLRVMAFAQLTRRASLRDTEACLSANETKLFLMGMRGGSAGTLYAFRCPVNAGLA